jgi:hypothetical protein
MQSINAFSTCTMLGNGYVYGLLRGLARNLANINQHRKYARIFVSRRVLAINYILCCSMFKL